MLNTSYYLVADLGISLSLPHDIDPATTLPSFTPFRVATLPHHDIVLRLTVCTAECPTGDSGTLLESTVTDMGERVELWHSPCGYRFLCLHPAHRPCVMQADPSMSTATAYLDLHEPHTPQLLSNMIRMAFAQVILSHGAVSIHSSTVVADGQAHMFIGRSGAGKSTHSRQWLAAFPGTTLLNDDNPVVRIHDGLAVAYGSPWSGKTPCYRQASAPVASITRIVQAPANSYTRLDEDEAFMTLLPSCSSIRKGGNFFSLLCDNVTLLAEAVETGILSCLPHPSAAIMLLRELQKKIKYY